MKIQLLLIPALLATYSLQAQNTSGKIDFEEKVVLKINVDGEAAKMMANMPKEKKSQKVLYFNEQTSLYRMAETKQKEETAEHDEGGAHVMIKMVQPDNKVYADLKNNKSIEQKEFMSRKFLIEAEREKMDWKLSGNTKTILGYSCQEATRQEKDKNISAWFTPQIPLSSGPASYYGLPGMILEININNGDRSITATHIDLGVQDTKVFEKPKEGKKVTKAEYEKIVAEKTKEMNAENGGNGNMIIKIER